MRGAIYAGSPREITIARLFIKRYRLSSIAYSAHWAKTEHIRTFSNYTLICIDEALETIISKIFDLYFGSNTVLYEVVADETLA